MANIHDSTLCIHMSNYLLKRVHYAKLNPYSLYCISAMKIKKSYVNVL